MLIEFTAIVPEKSPNKIKMIKISGEKPNIVVFIPKAILVKIIPICSFVIAITRTKRRPLHKNSSRMALIHANNRKDKTILEFSTAPFKNSMVSKPRIMIVPVKKKYLFMEYHFTKGSFL